MSLLRNRFICSAVVVMHTADTAAASPAHSGAAATSKRCENCNRLMRPGVLRNGRPEYPSYFAKKKFCSRICGGIANAAVRKMAIDAEQRA